MVHRALSRRDGAVTTSRVTSIFRGRLLSWVVIAVSLGWVEDVVVIGTLNRRRKLNVVESQAWIDQDVYVEST